MVATDANGIRVKPGHTGHEGPNLGEWVWIVERTDEKLFGPFTSRHDAIGWMARIESPRDWFTPRRIRSGSFRFDDVVVVNESSV